MLTATSARSARVSFTHDAVDASNGIAPILRSTYTDHHGNTIRASSFKLIYPDAQGKSTARQRPVVSLKKSIADLNGSRFERAEVYDDSRTDDVECLPQRGERKFVAYTPTTIHWQAFSSTAHRLAISVTLGTRTRQNLRRTFLEQ